jgi:enolase
MELEKRRRAVKKIVDNVGKILKGEPERTCAIAAPKEILGQILETMHPTVRVRIDQSVPLDLTWAAREVLDSRGNPTVEVDVILAGGAVGRAAVPSGASTGEHEAIELRDGDKKRYLGKGVSKAVKNVTDKILPALEGVDALDQLTVDKIMLDLDGTETKSKLGANAILAVSLANAKAAPKPRHAPLQVPRRAQRQGAAGADGQRHQRRRAFGRPDRFPGVHDHAARACHLQRRPARDHRDFSRAQIGSEEAGLSTAVGDEGGFAPKLDSAEDAIESIPRPPRTPATSGQTDLPGPRRGQLRVLQQERHLHLQEEHRQDHLGDELVDFYVKLCGKYPIVSIEDGCAEGDWKNWKTLTDKLGSKVQLVGDDLFVTNVKFLQKGIDTGTANSILVKVNQIGSLTETLDAVELAQMNGYTAVLSHRSGETEDATIADIAVATNCGQIKTGSLSRSPIGWPSTTNSCASSRCSADNAVYAGTVLVQESVIMAK